MLGMLIAFVASCPRVVLARPRTPLLVLLVVRRGVVPVRAPVLRVPVAVRLVAPVVVRLAAPVVARLAAPVVARLVAPVVARLAAPVVARLAAPVVARLAAPVVARLVAPVVVRLVAPVVARLVAPVVARLVAPAAVRFVVPAFVPARATRPAALFGVAARVRVVVEPVLAERGIAVPVLRGVARPRAVIEEAPALDREPVWLRFVVEVVLGFWAPLARLVVFEVMVVISPVSPSARAEDDGC